MATKIGVTLQKFIKFGFAPCDNNIFIIYGFFLWVANTKGVLFFPNVYIFGSALFFNNNSIISIF